MAKFDKIANERKAHVQVGLDFVFTVWAKLACNGGSCGRISLETFACESIPQHEPRLKASSSSMPRKRILSIATSFCV